MDELEYMPALVDSIRKQSFPNFKVIVCVNQPDEWWENADQLQVCENNQKLMAFLQSINDLDIKIIDKSSKGNGWVGKKNGVGWARKTIMNQIIKEAGDADIIISMDADTTFKPGYFQSVAERFQENPKAVALAVPYYHRLTGDNTKDRAILRYEIYMRYYALNMWRIGSPYSFTAIGSAIALPAKSYKTIGGITPHKSGEDFYFLQKLRKYGEIMFWNEEKVFPAARYSSRVGFGTGPAMKKGADGIWDSYPIYPYAYFDEVKVTYELFPFLFEKDLETPMDRFNEIKFGEVDIWKSLRGNFKQKEKFIRACHHKIDGFRVFQYLKWRNDIPRSDESNFVEWILKFYGNEIADLKLDLNKFSFSSSSIEELNQLRDKLIIFEEQFQKSSIGNY
jgi:glycosyltransferase involved in cell wall biosynthesis